MVGDRVADEALGVHRAARWVWRSAPLGMREEGVERASGAVGERAQALWLGGLQHSAVQRVLGRQETRERRSIAIDIDGGGAILTQDELIHEEDMGIAVLPEVRCV